VHTIHHDITLPGTPSAVYDALTTSVGHSAFTGAPATIDFAPGGAWSA
jgi:uncharacterized protein YndB with AHSA1/START domain